MKIGNRDITPRRPPFIVAEISGNHGGSLSRCIELIRAAKFAGADAVKTQCYDADTLTLDISKPDFIVQGGIWKGRTLYDLYNSAHTPPCWHRELYNAASSEGICIFSSVFDRRGVDLLESMDALAYKIASFEITDLPLIEYVASTHKPVIISTGMASFREIREANEAASKSERAFLHCVSDYPALPESMQLGRITKLQAMFEGRHPIGLSDHTLGWDIPVAGTALGIEILEKHIKLDIATVKTEDSAFSATPKEFKEMVERVRLVWAGLHDSGEVSGGSRQFRRSLYCVKDIKEGEAYTLENIRSIRPGYGLPPKAIRDFLGKKAKRKWSKGDRLV